MLTDACLKCPCNNFFVVSIIVRPPSEVAMTSDGSTSTCVLGDLAEAANENSPNRGVCRGRTRIDWFLWHVAAL
jgi:hypothetical protein